MGTQSFSVSGSTLWSWSLSSSSELARRCQWSMTRRVAALQDSGGAEGERRSCSSLLVRRAVRLALLVPELLMKWQEASPGRLPPKSVFQDRFHQIAQAFYGVAVIKCWAAAWAPSL